MILMGPFKFKVIYIHMHTKNNTQTHCFISNHNHKRSFLNRGFLWKAQHLLYSITIWVVFIRDIDPLLLVRVSNTEFDYKDYLESQLLGSLLQIISLLNNQRNMYWAKREGMFSRGIQIPRSQTLKRLHNKLYKQYLFIPIEKQGFSFL